MSSLPPSGHAPSANGWRTLWLAPVFVLAGVGLGRFLPFEDRGSGADETNVSPRAGRADASPLADGPTPTGTDLVPMPSFHDIVARVAGSVVGIKTIHDVDADGPAAEQARTGESGGVSRGTGFFIHERGIILTAHHVVAQPLMIVVRVPGHETYAAELIGEDPTTDLAVLRLIESPPNLQGLELGDSRGVRPGDWVLTVGNPLQFRNSVGVGVVSYVGRHLMQTGQGVSNANLQFTVPSNPGSSGSPVVDMRGEVVGITVRAARDAEGLSFAIPTHVIDQVLRSMEKNDGRARRAFLGVGLQPIGRDERARGGIREQLGVRIETLAPNQPAAKAGLQRGDIVIAFDGEPVDDPSELHDRITWSEPGATVELVVVRDGAELPAMSVQLGEVGQIERGVSQ